MTRVTRMLSTSRDVKTELGAGPPVGQDDGFRTQHRDADSRHDHAQQSGHDRDPPDLGFPWGEGLAELLTELAGEDRQAQQEVEVRALDRQEPGDQEKNHDRPAHPHEHVVADVRREAAEGQPAHRGVRGEDVELDNHAHQEAEPAGER